MWTSEQSGRQSPTYFNPYPQEQRIPEYAGLAVNRIVHLPGYAEEDVYHEAPPPAYPHSPSTTPSLQNSRNLSTQTTSGAIPDTNMPTRPPPDYTDCTFPPPTYDDLYESQVISPKRKGTGRKIEAMKKLAVCLCVACLASVLLVFGLKHMILGTCTLRRFLDIWCIATGGILFLCVVFAIFKSVRIILKKIEHLAPILIYSASVFSISWFIGGLIYSWDQLHDDRCSTEVPRVAFAACIFIFCSLIFFCCCGRDIFSKTRTRPND